MSSLLAVAAEPARPLTIDDAVALALQHNPALQASSALVDASQARVQDARSGFYPRVDARFIAPFVGTESGVSLNQTIWDFRHTAHLVQARTAQVRSSTFDQAAQRQEIVFDTRSAFYSVLIQRAVLEAAETTVREYEKRFERAEALFNIGRLPRLELTRAEITLSDARLSLIEARHQLASARIQLASVMGMPETFNYELVDALEYRPVDPDMAQPLQAAHHRRPELRSLEAREEALRDELTASKQEYYPTIIGRVEYRVKGAGAEQPAIIAGIGVRYRIFEGFAKSARVKEARANLRHASAELLSMQHQVSTEVQQAYNSLTAAAERIPVTRQARRAAAANLATVKERYNIGRASIVELAEAETFLASTTARYVRSVCDYNIAVAQLERARGNP